MGLRWVSDGPMDLRWAYGGSKVVYGVAIISLNSGPFGRPTSWFPLSKCKVALSAPRH